MQTQKRRFKPSVIAQLVAEPYRFQFFQALQVLEKWLWQNGIDPETILTDYIRFRNSLSLQFPASQIENLQIEYKDTGLAPSLEVENLRAVTLTPAFMGFLGAIGSLPNHYTEQISAHLFYDKSDAPRAFLDVFSSRAVSLFYRAWTKYRLPLGAGNAGQDRFLPLLLSLSGLGYPDLQGRLHANGHGVLDDSIAHFAAVVRHKPVSPAVLQQVLAAYFAVPVKIEQFIGHWYWVPRQQLTGLGTMNAKLDVNALVGERVWQRDLRIRIELGVLDKAQFDQFLPCGKSAQALNSLLTLFTQHEFEYEIKLVLAASHVHGNKLDGNPENSRLGWDTFLLSHPETKDRGDVCYAINTI